MPGDQDCEVNMSLAKKALRKEISAKLAKIPQSEIRKHSVMAAQTLRDLSIYKTSQNIAFYMHMASGELETDSMIAAAFADKKRVFLPQIIPLNASTPKLYPKQRAHLRMLEMETLDAVNALEPKGKYQIREPTDGKDCLEEGGLDLIIMPGVAFSSTCERLGHGAAFYDSFIQEHFNKISRQPKLVGASLPQQLVDAVPTEAHDEPLDAVIVGDTVHFRAGDSKLE